MTSRITSPLVHSNRSAAQAYPYRSGLGLMPAAEFAVLHDDFLLPFASDTTIGWTAVVDSGCTNVTNTTATTGANGIMSMTSDTTSEGTVIYGAKSIQLISGKKFFMECRVQMNEVTDNAFQFGLSDLTSVTNPEDLWTTVAANLITFGILDGAATTSMLCDKSNSGSTAETGTRSLTAATWHRLAIAYDGGTKIRGYVDGKLSSTWAQAFASTVPTATALAPFIGHLNGNGSGTDTAFVDYVRIVCER